MAVWPCSSVALPVGMHILDLLGTVRQQPMKLAQKNEQAAVGTCDNMIAHQGFIWKQ
jgi:hypothetical protein